MADVFVLEFNDVNEVNQIINKLKSLRILDNELYNNVCFSHFLDQFEFVVVFMSLSYKTTTSVMEKMPLKEGWLILRGRIE